MKTRDPNTIQILREKWADLVHGLGASNPRIILEPIVNEDRGHPLEWVFRCDIYKSGMALVVGYDEPYDDIDGVLERASVELVSRISQECANAETFVRSIDYLIARSEGSV